MKYIKIFAPILAVLLVTASLSCKKKMDELLNNPNYPSLSTADVDLYLNEVQLDFNNFWQTTADYGGQLSRQLHWNGPFYRNGYSPSSFDNAWTVAYSGVFTNANALIGLAQTQRKYVQSGMARVLKAYTLGMLVDNFGDVPYSEANKGNDNTVPKVDAGATSYAAVQALLDSAIADFGKSGATFTGTDLFYNGSKANWITLAKTLKLKFYMQVRLTDNTVLPKIQALITENNLINSPSQDFVFRYGTQVTSPDSRHPHYGTDYTTTGNGEYLSNYFIWTMTTQKYGGITNNTTGDPRVRYYFYRQATNYAWATSSTCPCYAKSQFGNSTFPTWYPAVPSQTPYCTVGKGYHGRDHGDNSGSPPDGSYTTAWGVYPAAGQFDQDQAQAVNLGMGGQGQGINPIWLSSFTSFLEAEAALVLGITTAGTPRALLQKGVQASIVKVMAFPATVSVTPNASYVPSSTQISNYVDLVTNNYDTATSNDSRLNMIMTEYYIALWGNGYESYNNLRRTGKPANIQLPVAVSNPGFFMRSFFYPGVFVNRNSNAPAQKDPGNAVQKVFWDNNPDNFIK